MDALGGKDLPWFKVSESKLEVEPEDPATVFYNDLPESVQQEQIARLDTFSYQMFSEDDMDALQRNRVKFFVLHKGQCYFATCATRDGCWIWCHLPRSHC